MTENYAELMVVGKARTFDARASLWFVWWHKVFGTGYCGVSVDIDVEATEQMPPELGAPQQCVRRGLSLVPVRYFETGDRAFQQFCTASNNTRQ